MKYVYRKDLKISAFSLGTVQLGMDYGLGEHTEKPSKKDAFAVLDSALKHGVNMLDTANNYGESEQVIGEWLQGISEQSRPLIVTKVGPFDHSSPQRLREDILQQTEKCLETLGVQQIDVLMSHNFEDYEKDPQVLRETFAELKRKGVIRYSALSAYSRHDYRLIAESGFDAVQIPLNVFDWTHIDDGGIQAIADADMMIFARSVFLQGLVFLKPEDVENRMEFCRPYLETYLQLCREFDISPALLAMSYVLSVPGVTSVVLGCQNPEQVRANCGMMDDVRPLTESQMEKLHAAFQNIDPRVIDPGRWGK